MSKAQDAALRATWKYSVHASGRSNLKIVGGADGMRMLSREEAWDTMRNMAAKLSSAYNTIVVYKGSGDRVYGAYKSGQTWQGQDGRVL